MSLFERTLKSIEENKQKRERGEHISIPFPFARFSRYVPGIQKGRYIITTANSKVGKTKFTDFLFMYSPIQWLLNNNTDINIRINYFSLEMSKEDKMKEAISHQLFLNNPTIQLSPEYMDSLYEHYILDDDKFNKMKGLKDYFEKFEESVTFIDEVRNPYGIYKYVRDYAHDNGNYYDKDGYKIDSDLIRRNDENALKAIEEYKPNKPNEFVINITDHVSLLTPENNETLHSAMGRFSSTYSLRMRDRWKHIVVNVQQQAASQESVENLKLERLQPSADGLGDNKLTQRDCDMMLGLFSPARHKIRKYEGYDITKLKNNHRELSVILNRRGGSVATQLLFLGAVNYFQELPTPENIDYEKLLNI